MSYFYFMEENGAKETIPELLGKNVRKYRKQLGLTQEQLSERLKISQKHLSIVETGGQFASASLIARLSDELGVPPAALFGGDSCKDDVARICTFIDNFLRPRFAILDRRLDNLEKLVNGGRVQSPGIFPGDVPFL